MEPRPICGECREPSPHHREECSRYEPPTVAEVIAELQLEDPRGDGATRARCFALLVEHARSAFVLGRELGVFHGTPWASEWDEVRRRILEAAHESGVTQVPQCRVLAHWEGQPKGIGDLLFAAELHIKGDMAPLSAERRMPCTRHTWGPWTEGSFGLVVRVCDVCGKGDSRLATEVGP